MPVTQEERSKYLRFVEDQVAAINGMKIDGSQVIWHYTTGDALVGIIQSGALYSTQVSCLNDSTEVHYGETLLREALIEIQKETHPDEEVQLLGQLINESALENAQPSDFFVTCFSSEKDDLSQWRAYGGGENGYAIAFFAGGFFKRGTSIVVRVNYDRQLHVSMAGEAARATLSFFREGLDARSSEDRETWASDFRQEWFRLLGNLAPMVKDPAFSAENEYRIVHTFVSNELSQLRFRQKGSLMSLHLPLLFPPPTDVRSSALPIAEVMVGPGRHKEVSRLSAKLLLNQNGYHSTPVTLSRIPFQTT
jgi:hypothetical protein